MVPKLHVVVLLAALLLLLPDAAHARPPRRAGASARPTSASVAAAATAGAACTSVPLPRVSNAATWNCTQSSVGRVCRAGCKAGFAGSGNMSTTCRAGAWTKVSGRCATACRGVPPAELLEGIGEWPASCAGSVAMGNPCAGSCLEGFSGRPLIQCLAGGVWATTIQSGGCHQGPVCVGTPTEGLGGAPRLRVLDSTVPQSCRDAPANATACQLQCKQAPADAPWRYGNPARPPTVACLEDKRAKGGARWDTEHVSGNCDKVCKGMPDDALLAGLGKWAEECRDATRVLTVCRGVCRWGVAPGSTPPAVACSGDGWGRSVGGACNPAPTRGGGSEAAAKPAATAAAAALPAAAPGPLAASIIAMPVRAPSGGANEAAAAATSPARPAAGAALAQPVAAGPAATAPVVAVAGLPTVVDGPAEVVVTAGVPAAGGARKACP